jgi:hypothetical protein
MIIIYQPEGQDERRWDLRGTQILHSEGEAVERVTGQTWAEVEQQLSRGSARSMRAVAWVLVKRGEPTLRYSAFDPPLGAVQIDFDHEERAVLREEIEKNPDLSDAERAAALEELADPEPAEDTEDPKAEAPVGEDLGTAA